MCGSAIVLTRGKDLNGCTISIRGTIWFYKTSPTQPLFYWNACTYQAKKEGIDFTSVSINFRLDVGIFMSV